jgi:hypothetical protein
MEPKAFLSPTGVVVTVDHVVQLLTDPSSTDLVARHAAALRNLCFTNCKGFYICDLVKVSTLLDFTVLSVSRGQTSFQEPLAMLLRCDTSQAAMKTPCNIFYELRTSLCARQKIVQGCGKHAPNFAGHCQSLF